MRIAVVPGDGIGPEVTREALKVLGALVIGGNLSLSLGCGSLPEDGRDDSRGRVRACSRATSTPSSPAPSAIRASRTGGTRTRSCSACAAGSTSSRTCVPCARSTTRVVPLRKARASDVDFVLFRENTEGAYSGRGRVEGAGTSDEEAVEEDVTTRRGVERICRAAFAFAAALREAPPPRAPPPRPHGGQAQRPEARRRPVAPRLS